MDISYIIKNEKWEEAFSQYENLYSENKCDDVALSFAFFCWFLLWQRDEFPDKQKGISEKSLEKYLDETSDFVLDSGKTEYIALIYHMKKIYPYFFKNSVCPPIITDSETANIILNYSDDQKCTSAEKEIVINFFSRFTLIKNYFEWLL